MATSTKFVSIALLAWLCVAVVVGLTGIFTSASAPAVAVTVWTLTAVVLLSWWKIPGIKAWVSGVDLSLLIALHLIRFVGIYFLVLCQTGMLSCAFARTAGVGDIAIAIGAMLLLLGGAVRRGWRTGIAIWNTLGLIDIVFVAFNAMRVGLHDWHGMAPLRSLPLMLLPTFLVPLIIASHIIIFARLSRLRDMEHG